jgi:hypothetical protein
MAFQFSERHIEEYNALGYTVFRGIVPPTLIDDLRRECDRAVEMVRVRDANPNAQRFQPIAAFEIDQKPFEAFRDLPEIRESVKKVLDCEFELADLNIMGVLIEPAEQPYCTQWHRDWRDNIPGVDLKAWEARYQDRQLFNQVNCALYEDSCTWVVPGSHLRRDTTEEIERFPARPVPGPELEGLSNAARERACLEYCQSLPGAQRLLLDAGDYCLYRNSLWHLGNYIPYRKRATLHDGIMTPSFREWFETAPKIASERRKEGITWENPNAAFLESREVAAVN